MILVLKIFHIVVPRQENAFWTLTVRIEGAVRSFLALLIPFIFRFLVSFEGQLELQTESIGLLAVNYFKNQNVYVTSLFQGLFQCLI